MLTLTVNWVKVLPLLALSVMANQSLHWLAMFKAWMPAPIDELPWDDWNAEHLARHHVSPTEVDEVCCGEPWILRGREGRFVVFGQTRAGRRLLVILEDRGGVLFDPITTRQMTEAERRRDEPGRDVRFRRFPIGRGSGVLSFGPEGFVA